MAKLAAKPFSCGAQPFKKPRLLFKARFQLFLGYTPSEQTGFVCMCAFVCMCISLNNMSHFLFVCVADNVYALVLCKCMVCVPLCLSLLSQPLLTHKIA